MVLGLKHSRCRSWCDVYSLLKGYFSPQKEWIHLNVMFNAFNVLNGQFFFNVLKSYRLENLTDKRLMEVTFGVTIDV